eukprot:3126454-Lingulodinium_polyedra.AAC.1
MGCHAGAESPLSADLALPPKTWPQMGGETPIPRATVANPVPAVAIPVKRWPQKGGGALIPRATVANPVLDGSPRLGRIATL